MLSAFSKETSSSKSIDGLLKEMGVERLRQATSKEELVCPGCRGGLVARIGEQVIPHFAHRAGTCSWHSEPESPQHLEGKRSLRDRLAAIYQDAKVETEVRVAGANRLADVMVTLPDGRMWAVEYQCANLSAADWMARHTDYQRCGIDDYWVLGGNRYPAERAPSVFKETATFRSVTVALDQLARTVATTQGTLAYLFVPKARISLLWNLSATSVRNWRAMQGTDLLENVCFPNGKPELAAIRLYSLRQSLDKKLAKTVRCNRADLEPLVREIPEFAPLLDRIFTLYGSRARAVVIGSVLASGRVNPPSGAREKALLNSLGLWLLAEIAEKGEGRVSFWLDQIPGVGPYRQFRIFIDRLAQLAPWAKGKTQQLTISDSKTAWDFVQSQLS
jgi:hypothetical protein